MQCQTWPTNQWSGLDTVPDLTYQQWSALDTVPNLTYQPVVSSGCSAKPDLPTSGQQNLTYQSMVSFGRSAKPDLPTSGKQNLTYRPMVSFGCSAKPDLPTSGQLWTQRQTRLTWLTNQQSASDIVPNLTNQSRVSFGHTADVAEDFVHHDLLSTGRKKKKKRPL